MSKLAHSSQEHMDEIERQDEGVRDEPLPESIAFTMRMVEDIARMVDGDAFQCDAFTGLPPTEGHSKRQREARIKAGRIFDHLLTNAREFLH